MNGENWDSMTMLYYISGMACLEVCSKNAINIKDSIKSYNAIIDEKLCINCNACRNVCQVNNNVDMSKPIIWKQGWASDVNIRKKSSSGGAAAAIARSFVENGGILCSCCFSQGEFVFDFEDDINKLARFAVCLAKTFSEGRVFSGIYLMLIGALIQKYSKWINNAMVRYSCIIFVTLFIFDVFIDNVFLRLSVCVAFFIFVQNLKVKKVTDAQSHFLRRMSTVVFYAHMIIFFLWGLIDGKEPSYGFTGFIASLVGTVVLAVIISANRIKNSRLVRELFG